MEAVVKLYCLEDNDNKMQIQNSCNHRILLNYFILFITIIVCICV